MKKTIFIIMLLILSIVKTGYPVTGNEAVQRFIDRMRSIGTMEGVITINYSNGAIHTGAFKYKAGGLFYLKLSNPAGKIIVSNNKKLWLYDSTSGVCGVQDLNRSVSGGIASMVSGYLAIVSGGENRTIIKLKNREKHYSDITLLVDKNYTLKKAAFKNKDGDGFSITLSNIRTGHSLHNGLFNFNVPSNAQVIQNPLNIR